MADEAPDPATPDDSPATPPRARPVARRVEPVDPDDRDRDDRPARSRRRRDDDYDDEDGYDRPRRRRRDDEYDDEDDGTGGLIPYKNGMALAAYYCAVFSAIPCVGAILGPTAVVLGVLGLGHAKKHPRSHGQAHAWIGIVGGACTGLLYIGGPLAFFVYAALNKK